MLQDTVPVDHTHVQRTHHSRRTVPYSMYTRKSPSVERTHAWDFCCRPTPYARIRSSMCG